LTDVVHNLKTIRAAMAIAALAIAAACGSDSPTGPSPVTPPKDTVISFPGFDLSLYPGDAAMRAWTYPASPYYWTGYYFPAPCHRDTSWSGKYTSLRAMGWGVTAIYVGQQDWSQIPSAAAARAVEMSQGAATCSASLLSTAQGTDEAADAVAKMRADGFPDRAIVFLDVEYVTTVTPALLDYYRAWVSGVLREGHYRPGVYAAKSNAQILYAAAVDSYRAAGSSETPAFWIAASAGFSPGAAPTAVGLDFAKLWQGMFEQSQTFNGVTLRVDVNVASSKSPSTP